MTPDRVKDTIVVPAASRARDSRMHRSLWLAFALLAAAAIGMFVRSEFLRSEVDDLAARSDQNSAVAQQLADQVRALGAVPVAQPASGPAGATGARGPAGPAGPPGQKGDKGDAGSAGAQGAAGADGKDGADGTDGKDGADGEDGVEGPAGPAGPQGPAGPPGAQGPPGPTCPEGYTAQSREQGDETWWVCVADDAEPPTEEP
ncbi:hypothetical protein ABZ215_13480 [Amycolatopsis sp. NPDC006131]|uniref:hypothetical protein n=1 Tax=Amycolatopsis sp. NPDC006131 TaxID=3156731 RepID=UPI0033B77A4A